MFCVKYGFAYEIVLYGNIIENQYRVHNELLLGMRVVYITYWVFF